jgi:hypothetical protein
MHSYAVETCINFVRALPPALEHLKIWRNSVTIVDCLKEMFDGCVLPPKFKLLNLYFEEQQGSPPDSELEKWQERAPMGGVVLKWERTPSGYPID